MNDNQVSETKGIVKDLAGSTVEVGTSLVIENLPEFGAEVAGIIGNEAIGATIQTLTGGLLGAVAPSLLGVKLSFQQKRFERNMIKMVTSLREKQDIIEQRMNQLNPEVQQKFISGPYRDVLLDNIVSENQEQKVQDNINGYINLMGIENPNDDIVFTFFHTLSQMNELDIRILRLYRPTYEMSEEEQESFQDVMRDEDIDQSQYNFIREKLCRLGMLYSKNTEKRDENLDILGEKLTELIKQLHSKKPKEVKAPKLKRITRSESYRITRLGRQYLTFIDEPQ
ncbi:MAG: hypothetical protein IKU29_03100 [Parabacteroides sp.]|nr:hypothetical protein [Parabacteroides sp.]